MELLYVQYSIPVHEIKLKVSHFVSINFFFYFYFALKKSLLQIPGLVRYVVSVFRAWNSFRKTSKSTLRQEIYIIKLCDLFIYSPGVKNTSD